MIVAGDSRSRFEFSAPGRIVFGPGALGGLPGEVAPFGRKVLLVTGSRPQRLQTVVEGMQAAGLTLDLFSVAREPTVGMLRDGVGRASSARVDVVVGIGGGSAMDAAKAIAALLGNGGDPLDYLEVVGAGRPLSKPSVPLFLAPTTAGTGTEATRNAVLLSEQHHVKVSLRSVNLLPRLALVDPELTYGLPPKVTAWGGLDALTQLIEPYVGCRPQPMTDVLSLEGMRRIARSLRRAFHDGGDMEARLDLSLAALLSGLALANAGLGIVHGFAGVIGGMIDAHHGMVCASLLPAGMQANLTALRTRAPGHPSLQRHAELAAALTGHADASPEDGIAWVQQLSRELGAPRLSQMGLKTEDVDVLVARAAVASSTKGNPIPLTTDELLGIVQASW